MKRVTACFLAVVLLAASALAALDESLRLDPHLVYALVNRARVWKKKREFRRAIELNPNYAIAHQFRCFDALAEDIDDANEYALAGTDRFLDDAERALGIPFTREL